MPRLRINGTLQELAAPLRLTELLAQNGLSSDMAIAVAVNGAVLRRAAWADTVLQTDDEVEIVQPLVGG